MAEPKKPLRVMADANILVAGILFPRWFHEFLRHALKDDFRLILSSQVIREARARMARGTVAQQQALEQFLADCDYEEIPSGPMGFDSPRLCVQVKSSASPADVTI
jgi:rRNA-processing protein FCF1